MKAKNGKQLTRAHARRVHFLQADVTFLAVGKRTSKAKNTIFGFGLFYFVVTICFYPHFRSVFSCEKILYVEMSFGGSIF